MDKNLVTYGAIFTKEDDDRFSIEIPDVDGAFTCADSITEGVNNCQEVIGVCLYNKEEYPVAYEINPKSLNDNQFLVYINVYLPYQFSKTKEVYKNKMLTVPVWLEALGKEKNINFSRVLQEALKKELKIK